MIRVGMYPFLAFPEDEHKPLIRAHTGFSPAKFEFFNREMVSF